MGIIVDAVIVWRETCCLGRANPDLDRVRMPCSLAGGATGTARGGRGGGPAAHGEEGWFALHGAGLHCMGRDAQLGEGRRGYRRKWRGQLSGLAWEGKWGR